MFLFLQTLQNFNYLNAKITKYILAGPSPNKIDFHNVIFHVII